MSKELEALKRIRQETCSATYMLDFDKNECCDIIEKSLKALEIIKKKRVNIGTFIHLTKILKKDYEQCKALNNTFGANICETEKEFLTKEEFNLLKEVLE